MEKTGTEFKPVMIALRRSLIGAVTLLDKALDLPATYPSKEERRLLRTIRQNKIDLQAIRQFIAQQLT